MQRLLKAFSQISIAGICITLLVFTVGLKVHAAGTEMIEVESDRLDVNKSKGEAVFQGNVKAVQGNIVIKGAILTLYLDSTTKKINKLIAEKNVYIKWDDKESTCDRATYTLPNRVLDLVGNAVITRGPEKVSGQKIMIDMITDRQIVEGGQTGRVKLRVNSGSESGVLEWKK